MKTQTKRLTESAMLLAVAIVLELISKMFIPELPFGGQITLMSMLPVVLISYRHGVKWGLVSGVTYALLEMALGAKTVAAAFQPGYFGDGTMLLNAFIMCALDYLVAFTALGLGGMFRNREWKPVTALAAGSVVALGLRYVAHVLSGYILFAGVFLINDPVTAPRFWLGRLFYGVLSGCMVMLLQRQGRFEAGTCFAVLIMNAFAPIIDRWSWHFWYFLTHKLFKRKEVEDYE